MKLEKNHLLNATGYTYPLQDFRIEDTGFSGLGLVSQQQSGQERGKVG